MKSKFWIGTLSACLFVCVAAKLGAQPGERPGPSVIDGPVHEDVEISIDLPASEHIKNIARRGKGCCTFATLGMQGRWHNCRLLFDILDHIEEGGGWPEKQEAIIKQFAPGVKFVQYEGTDPAILDRAIADGSPVGVTYGLSPRYGNETIYHMVMLVHIDAKWAVILDNNFPGTYEWMSRSEFLRRWVHPQGKGWAVLLLEPPPPPPPRNAEISSALRYKGMELQPRSIQ